MEQRKPAPFAVISAAAKLSFHTTLLNANTHTKTLEQVEKRMASKNKPPNTLPTSHDRERFSLLVVVYANKAFLFLNFNTFFENLQHFTL